MIANRLVRIGQREIAERLVKNVRFAQIAADRRCISGLGVGTGQYRAADFRKPVQLLRRKSLQRDGKFHVPQLSTKEMVTAPPHGPAQENVTG